MCVCVCLTICTEIFNKMKAAKISEESQTTLFFEFFFLRFLCPALMSPIKMKVNCACVRGYVVCMCVCVCVCVLLCCVRLCVWCVYSE